MIPKQDAREIVVALKYIDRISINGEPYVPLAPILETLSIRSGMRFRLDPREGNVVLIQELPASPELLEAAQKALDLLCVCGQADCEQAQDLRSAISRATGEGP